ncbi:hypothetical protein BCR36DRAFT_334136 [Piromyces finnis]|uniref:DNA primase large subunit n=1 Tax=Piromyces finnis TaxID=1754191 RepID=A0A1Y1V3A1_9FUNG|nr:hypothetical protein BCR36DRAFT_334136 [Piromyces finnis]|eukprot:ORX44889.1 hypothetical protein BCR36DRAFT_334136 [Piromyces finnis]
MQTSVNYQPQYSQYEIKPIPVYPYSLNLYMNYPQEDIEINEFEIFGLDRLKLLKEIENHQIRSTVPLNENTKLLDVIKNNTYINLKENSSTYSSVKEKYEERRKDYLSHYILKLAYCQTEDLRDWFIKQECILFQIRWNNSSKSEKQGFVQSLNLNLENVSMKEKEKLRDKLETLISLKSNVKNGEELSRLFSNKNYFKINFEEVLDLVQSRSVLIKNGLAYVPDEEIISVIISKYKSFLTESMEYLSSIYNKLLKEDNDRLDPILKNIANQYIDEGYTAGNNGVINHQDIPNLTKYFPLCMQNLQKSLQMESHLRHGGRMQYGLFLKGIGVSLEESLLFWKKAFSKKFNDDQFQKGYAYNIRHSYGMEGKRTNYSPFSCSKIIMTNPPSTGDHHGCPFRHASTTVLEKMLYQTGINKNHVPEICSLAKLGHYQLACTKMLTIFTNANEEEVENVIHPNRYFDQSYPESEYNKNKKQSSNTMDTQKTVSMEF